jgi:hypothetical protein
MRTKILLSAALVAAGIAAADAQQVYSVNAVGYVNVTLAPGYNLLSNPLNGTNNNVNTIIPTAPEGSSLYKWNSVAQSFYQADAYAFPLGWIDDQANPSTTVLAPGEGFFIQNPAGATTITFVGEVPQGSLTNKVFSNYGFYGSQVPQSATLTALGFPGAEGMNYNAWNKNSQSFAQAYSFASGIWFDPDGNPGDPTLGVAEGFLLQNPGAPRDWTRTFSVNN